MTNLHQKISTHQSYFICIEDDLLHLSRWIEFSEANASVYSIELARLLMTASAEVEIIAKAICKATCKKPVPENIIGYQKILMNAAPRLPDVKVHMPRYGMIFQPWSCWRVAEKSPDWWSANNAIKHDRANEFHGANLGNVLNAVAGLLVLLMLLHSEKNDHLYPAPRLFEPDTFAIREGSALRLIVTSTTNFSWCE
jgi:hypothetical protein